MILSGDHIYKMDYADLLRDHIESKAVLTIGCIPCSLDEGTEFGVMQVDGSRRIVDFQENFKDDPGIKIPKVYLELTTEKVLVMEELTGISLNSASQFPGRKRP